MSQNLYYRWSKEFLEAGKKRLSGDTAREASSEEVKGLRRQAGDLKEVVAELMLENRLLKQSMTGDPRRLLPLHHRLEALHHHEGRGRHRHAGDGARGIRL
jgi:transposase